MKCYCVKIKNQDCDLWSSCVFAHDKQQALRIWLDKWGNECCCDIHDVEAIHKPIYDGRCDDVVVFDDHHLLAEKCSINDFWDA